MTHSTTFVRGDADPFAPNATPFSPPTIADREDRPDGSRAHPCEVCVPGGNRRREQNCLLDFQSLLRQARERPRRDASAEGVPHDHEAFPFVCGQRLDFTGKAFRLPVGGRDGRRPNQPVAVPRLERDPRLRIGVRQRGHHALLRLLRPHPARHVPHRHRHHQRLRDHRPFSVLPSASTSFCCELVRSERSISPQWSWAPNGKEEDVKRCSVRRIVCISEEPPQERGLRRPVGLRIVGEAREDVEGDGALPFVPVP